MGQGGGGAVLGAGALVAGGKGRGQRQARGQRGAPEGAPGRGDRPGAAELGWRPRRNAGRGGSVERDARDPSTGVLADPGTLRAAGRPSLLWRARARAGVNELLFREALLAMRAVGARLVTLGAAPLAGLDKEEPQRPWIHRVLRFAYEHLDAFYHFQTLSGYKAKYAPHWWEPKYLVFHPRRLRARVLFAVLKAYDPRGATRLVLSRLAEGLREELAIDPDTGRPRVVGHALRLPGLLLQQDLLVAVALALAIGSGIGIVADHLRRSFDDVYVATLSSLIAASLTVALLRARDRHEAHP